MEYKKYDNCFKAQLVVIAGDGTEQSCVVQDRFLAMYELYTTVMCKQSYNGCTIKSIEVSGDLNLDNCIDEHEVIKLVLFDNNYADNEQVIYLRVPVNEELNLLHEIYSNKTYNGKRVLGYDYECNNVECCDRIKYKLVIQFIDKDDVEIVGTHDEIYEKFDELKKQNSYDGVPICQCRIVECIHRNDYFNLNEYFKYSNK